MKKKHFVKQKSKIDRISFGNNKDLELKVKREKQDHNLKKKKT